MHEALHVAARHRSFVAREVEVTTLNPNHEVGAPLVNVAFPNDHVAPSVLETKLVRLWDRHGRRVIRPATNDDPSLPACFHSQYAGHALLR